MSRIISLPLLTCFCQGNASLDSSINHYSTIFSFLDEHIDTDLVIEKELDFVWNQLQKNPDYLNKIDFIYKKYIKK